MEFSGKFAALIEDVEEDRFFSLPNRLAVDSHFYRLREAECLV
jgi:hypothetical protein